MLSDEERREIEAEIGHYEYRQAACIEALKIVQRTRGWISDETIQDLTGILEMTADEIDNVATFYNLIFRQPVGDHVILLCDSVSCWLMGYEELHGHLRQRLGVDLGQTTEDGAFTVLPMVCLGACDHAPVMMVDEDLHEDLTPEKVDQILDDYRNGNG